MVWKSTGMATVHPSSYGKNCGQKCLGSALWPSSREVNSCHIANCHPFSSSIALSKSTSKWSCNMLCFKWQVKNPKQTKKIHVKKYENWPKTSLLCSKRIPRHPPLGWLFFVSEACEPKRWASKNSHPLQSESPCCPNPFPSFCPGKKTTLCHFYAQTTLEWNHQRSFICRLKPFLCQLVGGWMLCQEGCKTTHFKRLPVLPLFFFDPLP